MFVDTSAWYALADAGDRWHVQAAGWLRRASEGQYRLATSNHVIGETCTLVAFDHQFAVAGFRLAGRA